MMTQDLVKVLKDNDAHCRIHYAGDMSVTFSVTSVYELDRLRVEVEIPDDGKNLIASIVVDGTSMEDLANKVKEMCKYKYKPFKRRVKRIVEDICNCSLINN